MPESRMFSGWQGGWQGGKKGGCITVSDLAGVLL